MQSVANDLMLFELGTLKLAAAVRASNANYLSVHSSMFMIHSLQPPSHAERNDSCS